MNVSGMKYLIALSALLCTGVLVAEPPHIGYAYPAGGTPGSEFLVKIGGQFIYGAKSAYINDKNIEIKVIDSKEPENRKPNRQKMAIGEIITIKVKIPDGILPGDHEIALITDGGISNKLIFNVGQLKEMVETEPNDKSGVATRIASLPVTLNGQIMPGDVDCYKFAAKKGQNLVVEAFARALIPYLADAVPGWFKICLSLSDANGREVAFADDFRFAQDPVLFYKIPADGDYILTIRDSIYRGREDFIYRARIGELPYITDIFPLGGRCSEDPVTVKIRGVNLPSGTMNIEPGMSAPTVRKAGVVNHGIDSNRKSFAVDNLPEIFAAKSCESREQKQKVALPVIINGCIREPGIKNYFYFEAVKGQVISVRVAARKLGSPLDSIIALYDNKGTVLKENDDLKDISEGFITHQADSGFSCVIPADGVYTIRINDTQSKGGQEYAYRLMIGAPSPDFALVVSPSSLFLPCGGAAIMTVNVIRYDEFKGEIRLQLKDNLSGLALRGGVIPENTGKIRVTLISTDRLHSGIYTPELIGTALIKGVQVKRPVTFADDLMQAFIYRHLVTADEATVLVNDNAPFFITSPAPEQGRYELVCGREMTLAVEIQRSAEFNAGVSIQLVDPPKGIILKNGFIPPNKKKVMVTVKADGSAVPGIDNLIFSATAYIDVKEPEPEKMTEKKTDNPVKMAENEQKKGSDNNNPNTKDVKTVQVKKPKKEKVVVAAPAIPVKIVKPETVNRKS